ncbi:MAG: 16S rRNA (cytosine(1402)-N(4))-methyltransferase RsmH [Erysipelotrichaceae bacterium]|nr:16S rRNA (cytosine(1402)-N(4))-methyltransferase RsmH [Erysipelotrichaceae bacterium]
MMEYVHKTVLLDEAVEHLNIKPDGIYVDATTGGGGHSSLILSKLTTGHLYCFDQDDYAFMRSKERLDKIGSNYTFVKSNFVDLKKALNELGVTKIDGIIYDLGVSSFQFDIPERGFSYNYDAPLDMRMNQAAELTAEKIVNEWSYEDIVRILYRYGEDPFSKQIARAIERERAIKPIHTTFELVDVIKKALPQKVLRQKGHPAKQTFQALRIAVNDELRVFEVSINDALEMLNNDGYAVVITFHSLEDRICKTVFKEASTVENIEGLPIMINDEAPFELVTRKPILPSEEELKNNNRAHSAKMRVIRKR